MKPSRGFLIWLALAVCAVLVVGAMLWLTGGALSAERERLMAERERAAAEARADLEERTRLALWRMDALGASMVLRMSQPSSGVIRGFSDDWVGRADAAETGVLLRFLMHEDGRLLLPKAVDAASTERLERLRSGWVASEVSRKFRQAVSAHGGVPKPTAPPEISMRSMPVPQAQRMAMPAEQLRQDDGYQQSYNMNEKLQRTKAVENAMAGNAVESSKSDVARWNRASAEKEQPLTSRAVKRMAEAPPPAAVPGQETVGGRRDRSESKTKVLAGSVGQVAADVVAAPAADELAAADEKLMDQPIKPAAAGRAVIEETHDRRLEVLAERRPDDPRETATEGGSMKSLWMGGELMLVRKTFSGPLDWSYSGPQKDAFVQGVWLDSKKLATNLLAEVADLLPRARLVPATDERAAADPLALVSFPFTLERGEFPVVATGPLKPALGLPLWAAWAGVVVAILTSALLVRGVMRLSERRASFVSAVTHELRTPLTTFRLYSDMLESGAVKEEKRGAYLRVLSREADRLSHLVENVLAFSRIERGNARSNVRSVRIGELLESLRERFESRLATAGMTLMMDTSSLREVRVDTAAVEHILFNLIDNAAKYASSGDPPRVDLMVRGDANGVEIWVNDHGPGVSPSERHRIFHAFHKSAREAAESQPGVGLGLALSRRLARAQGGELDCVDCQTGACFVLRLPVGRRSR